MKAVRLQEKLGKQNFPKDMKKVFAPVIKTFKVKDVSEDVTKTMILTSKENNKTLENLNHKLLDILNDRGIIASFLISPLSKITNSHNSSQFKLIKSVNLFS